jgi:hypothetical protein
LKVLNRATQEPDAAALLLYFLEFPCLVTQGAHKAGATSKLEFQFHRCFEKISSDQKLGRWCRNALAASAEHHVYVLKSAVGILKSSLEPKIDESRLYISLLKRSDGFDRSFQSLYEDLSRVVSFPKMPVETIITVMKLLLMIVISGRGKGHVMLTMRTFVDTPANLGFRGALRRVHEAKNKDPTGENLLHLFAALFDVPRTSIPCVVTLASSSEESMEPPPNAVARKPGRSPRTAAEKNLQLFASTLYKGGKVASPKSPDRIQPKSIEQRRSSATPHHRRFHPKLSPALLKQNEKIETEWIEANEDCDYYIFGDGETFSDTIVNFEDASIKSMFRDLRIDATDDPSIVLHLYCHVLASLGKAGDVVSARLRKQLYDEYGVDPFTVDDRMSDLMLQWAHDATKETRKFDWLILTDILSWRFVITFAVMLVVSLIMRSHQT